MGCGKCTEQPPLLMLIIIDICCTHCTWPGPSAVDQKTTEHQQQWKTSKRYRSLQKYITILEIQLSVGRGVDPPFFENFVLSSQTHWRSGSLCSEEVDHSIHLLSIYQPCLLFSTPLFIYPSIHLSIHQFISPLSHMWFHPSWPLWCMRSYIDTSTGHPCFSNWIKYTFFGRQRLR